MRYTTAVDVLGYKRGPVHPSEVAAQGKLIAAAGRTAMDAYFDTQIAAEEAGQNRQDVIGALLREKHRRAQAG